ncbi:hypothetical protein [Deinococcus pimensis]|uniref:hypothetical protein n=1 Tax=Deinococcus pimensis TaxID=309888 RepID=UPI000487D824|nr:hypothetical protein [Deinococcus pimensis]
MDERLYAIEVPEDVARREELHAHLLIAFARYLRTARPGALVVVPGLLTPFLDPAEFDVSDEGGPHEDTSDALIA